MKDHEFNMKRDAFIFITLALIPVATGIITSDDAAKILSPLTITLAKWGLSLFGTGIASYKGFLSLSYAQYLAQKQANGQGGDTTLTAKIDMATLPKQ